MGNAEADWLFSLSFLGMGSESDLLLEYCCQVLSKEFDL